jgi:hypothetical protein
LECEAAAQQGFGFCCVAETRQREAEQMGRRRVVRQHCEHRPARRRGLFQLALLQELTRARHRALKLGCRPDQAPEPGKQV